MSQLIKFALIGSGAALVHLGVLHLLVKLHWLTPIPANAVAFFTAFIFSYAGQSLWTFNHKQHHHQAAATRYLMVQLLCNFGLNQGGYTLLLKLTSLHYLLASILVLMTVPVITFTLSKYWAFR